MALKKQKKVAKVRRDSAAAPSSQVFVSNRTLVLLILLFALSGLNLHHQTNTLYQENLTSPENESKDEAMAIIRRSYESSYAHILPCEDTMDPDAGKACMTKTLKHFTTPGPGGNYTSLPSIPWWFQTLLRDIQNNGSYGWWHHYYTSTPPFHFCTFGKVATTDWRDVFGELNREECVEDPKSCKMMPSNLGENRLMAFRTNKEMPEDAPWAVFLRDPLERLLSGFLDKCYTTDNHYQNHCEPNVVYQPSKFKFDGHLSSDKLRKESVSMLEHITDKDKQYFAAYVDTLPLKWNVHFVPQAIFCDLYRNIDKYDFVGIMGDHFMDDLERMVNHFGGKLPEALNTVFRYKEKLKSGKKNTRNNEEHATHASEKVKKFYTAETVRRGLELLSIDYMLLGLEVPEWARQMLRDDARTDISD
eukprot:CAMPEP_0183715056 /NCGR_PEP_ID=MMETSP0737-20130205/9419_1 /TAXON_ID=385413 /ORGANISM="Thalassiosira miniscula, Strain CCMP1093" /LENGTH=417 /DNA_ID=CAMNT_0025944113 /DNA_START=461 /DNA_END=1714 /DNA_ORIENTATION=-